MQLPWDEHFHEIVVPAWLAYLSAERRLTEAISTSTEELIKRSGYDALREGGAASVYIHHFAEIVLRARASMVFAFTLRLGVLSNGLKNNLPLRFDQGSILVQPGPAIMTGKSFEAV
jgi:hypothetical protein